jgi:hypothetical protein
VALALLTLQEACVLPFLAPPSRVAVATGVDSAPSALRPPPGANPLAAIAAARGPSSLNELSAGVHTQSAVVEALPYDLGLGYVLHASSLQGGPTTRITHGLYGEATYFFSDGPPPAAAGGERRPWWRLGVSGRVAWLFDPGAGAASGFRATARLSAEVFRGVQGLWATASGGAFTAGAAKGQLAVAPFVESGYARTPWGSDSFVAMAGLAVRLPATAGLIGGVRKR